MRRTASILGFVAGLAACLGAAQSDTKPVNDLPDPYRLEASYFKMPAGRTWGSTSAVEIDKDGRSIWVAERCGANSCVDAPSVDIVLKFDPSGKLVKSFGAGTMIFPHGIFVDRDGNVWVTDGQDNAPRPQRGAGERGRGEEAAPPSVPAAGATKGHQVFKFSPEGK